ncbi:MAG: TIGR02646 family protein [Chitinophagales bacterium]|nr:TIGR02646 family protein [Chitinophagales bacterium]
MKYVSKHKPPQSLIDRRATQGAKYEAPQLEWQEQLLDEQGYICAYCMQRISLKRKDGKPLIRIEHYKPRQKYPKLDLEWTNMLGVCIGVTNGGIAHCDSTQGKEGKMSGAIELQVLHPLHKSNSENVLTYDISGYILPVPAINTELSEKIAGDLNICLNLNDEQIRLARKNAMDMAKQRLIQQFPHKTWTQKDLQNEIDYWSSRHNGKFLPYCQVAIWFLIFLKNKPKHK